MQHIDSGTLHAYLDNQLGDGARPGRQEIEAHLAQCPECRTSLEEAGRLRDRARGILSQSGPPQVTAPPFAEVLARAARQRTSRSRRPLAVLAWAASLVLAVTAGWYARSVVIRRTQGSAVANAVATGEPARAAGIEARPPAAQQVAQAVPARADTGAARPPISAGAGAVPSTTAVALQNRPMADLALPESKGQLDSAARKLAEEPQPAAAPTPTPAAPAPAAAEAPAMRRAAPREAQMTLAQSWVTVSPAEAARRLGGPLALIPGLPSLGTSVSGAGESAVVRTILVLGPGQTIELTQQRAVPRERALAPAAQPQAGAAVRDEGVGSVTVQWEGFSVSGRALVPQDSLRKLLQRLTGAEPLR
jgi:anti-sigma factor RsiW